MTTKPKREFRPEVGTRVVVRQGATYRQSGNAHPARGKAGRVTGTTHGRLSVRLDCGEKYQMQAGQLQLEEEWMRTAQPHTPVAERIGTGTMRAPLQLAPAISPRPGAEDYRLYPSRIADRRVYPAGWPGAAQ